MNYCCNTNKKHHLEYVNNHINEFDYRECSKFIDCDEDTINRMFEKIV